MIHEPKILLTIYMEGGLLIRQEAQEREYSLRNKDLFPDRKWKPKDGNKVVKTGKYLHYPTVPNEVTQKITLYQEAYDYMTSPECPSWYHKVKEWQKKLTKEQRLELHLNRTCQHFGGKGYTYSIVED